MSKAFVGLAGKLRRRLQNAVGRYLRVFRRVPVVGSGPGRGLRFEAGAGVNAFASGEYERPVQEAIAALVRPGDVFYDVGANLGFFTVLAARLVATGGMVYAFEPVPANASTVERNARRNDLGNVKVLRIALCRENGKAELLLARHVGGAVLKSAGTPPPDFIGSVMVEAASLDMLVERQRIRPPDVVKIDVEGVEMDVLLGMEAVLRRWHPKVVLELDDADAAECERKESACRAFLHALGYRTEVLPDAYPNATWHVRHFVAVWG